ncbi:MAG: hypothetical protein KAV87_58050, partial [Desulfobacteraceae bacterium]|nr:hypothetical protein [Desulfobacteraceae bacterium]
PVSVHMSSDQLIENKGECVQKSERLACPVRPVYPAAWLGSYSSMSSFISLSGGMAFVIEN